MLNFENNSGDLHDVFDNGLFSSLSGEESRAERMRAIELETRALSALNEAERLEFLEEAGFTYESAERASELFGLELEAWCENLLEKEAEAGFEEMKAELEAQED